ncbi:hypothetical protein ACKAV7_005336 [Fusarium commune]|uniref:Uncharacterized protein n=1 Tax=Fusarium oxysporum f. sp. rapae TaxID=485398 RepID=A0A8J5P6J5_FUSOX|nr:hypothetical protein Forpe1208_v003437 [Fusarium oxysporum f. sp. rapae]
MEGTNKTGSMETENTSTESNAIRYSNAVLNSIAEWVSHKKDIITYAQQTSGGWEGWAQVELAFYLTRAHGYQYNEGSTIWLKRESHVFTNSAQRIDIEISGPGSLLFELKCERGPPQKSDPNNPGHYIPDTTPSKSSSYVFADDMEDDKKKITTQLKANSPYAAVFAIGIAVTPEATAKMVSKKNSGFTQYKSNYNTGPITIWFWQLERDAIKKTGFFG